MGVGLEHSSRNNISSEDDAGQHEIVKRKIERERSRFVGSELFSEDNFRPETLQQKLRKQSRNLDTYSYLPGFGTFTPSNSFHDFNRPERQAGVQEAFSLDLRDDLIDIGYEDIIETADNLETHDDDEEDAEKISPVLVTLSDTDDELEALKLFSDDIYGSNADTDNR